MCSSYNLINFEIGNLSFKIYTISGGTVSASVNPEACLTGQTSTSISNADGKLVTYSDKATCKNTELVLNSCDDKSYYLP